MKTDSTDQIKHQLHPRNDHRHGYDFPALIASCAELSPFVTRNVYGNLSIDFADAIAVKTLNKALLLHFYQLSYWDIPASYLCPPVPGRADYIHYLADLLADDNQGEIPCGKGVRVLDIGVGANAIYPIIGHAKYGWSFVGSDINPTSIKIATMIAQANSSLKGALVCRLQKHPSAIFTTMIKANEHYVLTLCNPPFHASAHEAQLSNHKKQHNLGKSSLSPSLGELNFGGQDNELWCEGGESQFIGQMIEESQHYQHQCAWFTSFVSKKETLPILTQKLQQMPVAEVRVVPMAQGQKISRFIAWSFLPQAERKRIIQK
ncbi:23S rRNA m(6)A-1618 methyltransferase [Orbus hercynius]|uniref:Ribosomal RNA large subunit methyltransferase F n=1 Tax=Orbus hercynius TaxID=593135 RepID=A0A495RJL6_9GAMM|nr:23S rRNA (adenine(1618)-N(6))-methyltransferase RlmF [Orbus hercynius]RKS87733.1 23S rRNA m(6)A-1618 methyltransferase [Orbus hercynius]